MTRFIEGEDQIHESPPITPLTPEEIVAELRQGRKDKIIEPPTLSTKITSLTPEQIVQRLGEDPYKKESLLTKITSSFKGCFPKSKIVQMRRALMTFML